MESRVHIAKTFHNKPEMSFVPPEAMDQEHSMIGHRADCLLCSGRGTEGQWRMKRPEGLLLALACLLKVDNGDK